MYVVETIKDRCKRCYSCIRNCPVKAIRIEQGQALVIQERCICCGNCVRVCSQNAKKIKDETGIVFDLLSEPESSYAILAPSFPAAFHPTDPERVIGSLKKLGFKHVIPVALGADLIAREYARLAGENRGTIITTPCPAVVGVVEKYYPDLFDYLAPIVSPMIATGRYIRQERDKAAKIVFIGPCIAKKKERNDSKVSAVIDAVLTFSELMEMLSARQIDPDSCPPDSFGTPIPHMGGIFPISGGLLKTTHLKQDIFCNDVIVTEGPDRVLNLFDRLAETPDSRYFLDLLFCEGCINGPAMNDGLSLFKRRDVVTRYVNRRIEARSHEDEERIERYAQTVPLRRSFTNEAIVQEMPSEQDIKKIYAQINKFKSEDELNCGACGYPTCREKAIAVFHGRAEVEMCLPYLVEKLQRMNSELVEAQERLVRSAQLASMGELAAGIAHEINNPLTGVLTYLKLMQRIMDSGAHLKSKAKNFHRYLETMDEETTRVSEIVKGLLEFARPTEPKTSKVSTRDLISKTLFLIEHQIVLQNIRIKVDQKGELYILADEKQIQQVLINILINAAQAMPGGGRIDIQSRLNGNEHFVDLMVRDTGCGIARENLDKVFDPFFTTKEEKRGTGLGLSTAYSIVVKHGGDIKVKSQLGRGTQFIIRLPRYKDGGYEKPGTGADR